MVGDYAQTQIVYSNKKAKELYNVTLETTDLEPIFKNHSQGLVATFINEMKEKGKENVLIHDVITLLGNGEKQLADVHLGYFHKEEKKVYVEIIPKQDKRMEMAMHQVSNSSRAEVIFNLDQELSMIHCNKLFREIFQSSAELAQINSETDFSNQVQSEIQKILLKEIVENLANFPIYTTKIKIITWDGLPRWYSLELQRRTLDNSGTDKVMGYMVNIEDQVEIKTKLEDIEQYFSILQSLSTGMLYRLDTKNKILYRNEETAKIYGVSTVVENYPDHESLKEVFHHEDIEDYKSYIHRVLSGKEGSHTTRILTPAGQYEYHKVVFKAVYDEEGKIKAMVGCATNIHSLKETQKELEGINVYFQILQKMWGGSLYRFDIKNKIMYRSDDNAHSYRLPTKVENYPDVEQLKNVLHPEDLKPYLDFIETVIQGEEGELESRVKTLDGEYEYHKMMFRAMKNSDGTTKEMIGTARNIHKEKMTQVELADVNRQFDALQHLSEDLLFRIDIQKKFLIRHKNSENMFGISTQMSQFPEHALANGSIYPEDRGIYEEFASLALRGVGGSVVLRMREQKDSDYRYRRISWIPVVNHDGPVNEVVGKLVDVKSVNDSEE